MMAFQNKESNVPYTFNPGFNASIATDSVEGPQATTAPDRLIVGIDFGTTYSGGYPILSTCF